MMSMLSPPLPPPASLLHFSALLLTKLDSTAALPIVFM